jgi:hypothetical protein
MLCGVWLSCVRFEGFMAVVMIQVHISKDFNATSGSSSPKSCAPWVWLKALCFSERLGTTVQQCSAICQKTCYDGTYLLLLQSKQKLFVVSSAVLGPCCSVFGSGSEATVLLLWNWLAGRLTDVIAADKPGSLMLTPVHPRSFNHPFPCYPFISEGSNI